MANECIEADELMHYGVKGQKWHQRRYQNEDGTYTDLGKARRRVGYEKEATVTEDGKVGGKAYKDMSWSERRAAKKRARHNEAARREQRIFNKDKRDAIDRGDLSFISKNISRFTNDEINESIYRYKTMQSLKDLDTNDKQKKLDKFVDKTIYWLEKGSRGTKAASEISNNINDMMKKSAERKTTQVNLEKARTDLKYFKDPKSKPLTKKEELDLAKQQLELDWMRDPKSKPKTEKEELELQWLRDPKSKPKTEKEEMELRKQQLELDWMEYPDSKPLTPKEQLDLMKQRQEYDWMLDPKSKPKTEKEELELEWLKNPKSKPKTEKEELDLKKQEAEIEKTKKNAEVFAQTAEKNRQEAEGLKSKLDELQATADLKMYERDQAKANYQRKRDELQAAEEDTDNARSEWKEARRNNDPNADEYEKRYMRLRTIENDIRYDTDKARDFYKKADKDADKANDAVDDTKDAIKKAENDAAKAEANVDKANAKLEKYEYDTNYYSDDYWDNYERFGGWGKKDKSKTQKSGKYDWENTNQEIQDLNQKYLRKLNDAYFKDVANHDEGKLGYSIDRKGNVTTDARDVKWKKTMKKEAGDTRIIDQWVKEMKEKYMKEHGLSAKAAEQKAEDYVDYWLDLYDDDMI